MEMKNEVCDNAKCGSIINVGILLLVWFLTRFVVSNETGKVWWMNNLNKLKAIFASSGYVDAQSWYIAQMASQFDGSAKPAPIAKDQPAKQDAPDSQFPKSTLTADQILTMKKWFAVSGPTDAKVTIIEYTDPECPFCIRHTNAKTIDDVMKAFNGKVNHIVKPVQWVNHPGTEYKSLATICAGKIGGDKVYYKMFEKIMSSSTQQVPVAKEKIVDFAKELWLDNGKFVACTTSEEAKSIYTANRAEAQSVKANGTPGNLIINNTTNETTLVAGAYPLDQFKTLIEPMVK